MFMRSFGPPPLVFRRIDSEPRLHQHPTWAFNAPPLVRQHLQGASNNACQAPKAPLVRPAKDQNHGRAESLLREGRFYSLAVTGEAVNRYDNSQTSS